IRYEGRGAGYVFAFERDRVALQLNRRDGSARVVLRFLGAAPGITVEGEDRQAGTVSYFIGADAARWRTRLPMYAAVVYHEVWPGIDVAFRARSGRLKYEFRLRPGARPDDIRLAYSGASGLSLDRRGGLRVALAGDVLTDERPTTYQSIGSRRTPV